ncbi:hypothetical protein ACJX0J_007386 [Zea mays]
MSKSLPSKEVSSISFIFEVILLLAFLEYLQLSFSLPPASSILEFEPIWQPYNFVAKHSCTNLHVFLVYKVVASEINFKFLRNFTDHLFIIIFPKIPKLFHYN